MQRNTFSAHVVTERAAKPPFSFSPSEVHHLKRHPEHQLEKCEAEVKKRL